MSLDVTVDLEAYPEGQELAINGLGRVANGETVTLDEDQELAFLSQNLVTVEDALKDMEGITVKGKSKYSADDLPVFSYSTPPVEAEPVVEEKAPVKQETSAKKVEE